MSRHYCVKLSRADEALRVFDFLKVNGPAPDVVTCNSVSKALCIIGDIDGAEQVLNAMIDNQLRPTCATFGPFLIYCERQRDFDNFAKFFHLMLSVNVNPEQELWDKLERFHGKKKCVEFENMFWQKRHMAPDRTYKKQH